MKKYFLLTIFVIISSGCGTYKKNEVKMVVDTNQLERNLAECPDKIKTRKQEDIDKLKQPTISGVEAYLAGSFMTKYVEFSRNNQNCSVGLLNNAIIILQANLDAGGGRTDAKLELAKAKLMKAAFLPISQRGAAYNDAEKLIAVYLIESPIPEEKSLAIPHYFVAHAYLKAAELTSDESKFNLLNKAISISKSGENLKISQEQKKLLNEPIGIAYGEKAKYWKNKNKNEFSNAINESTLFFKQGYESGDLLAAYNIAVNYTLLENAADAKAWLLKMEEKHAVDKQVCLQGVLSDPDMEWLRVNERSWVVDFMRRNCASYLNQLKR